ncbi:MAG: ribonucleoside-diphosphate reductase, adenosylcobalamin-dependent [Bacteroidia bacterium]|nr:MAG: ribonucleoside-diphosphate reductase, adenosylcobalamin-dependent [Bacteroidia bacterium]
METTTDNKMENKVLKRKKTVKPSESPMNVENGATKNYSKPYSYSDVFNNTLEYFGGDELATNTWISKYCLKDSKGLYYELTPDDMHKRMAKEFARIERKYKQVNKTISEKYKLVQNIIDDEQYIYELFKNFKYVVPQGSVMSALGNPFMIASLSNCVVLPEIYDSYGGIFYTDQQLAQLFKRRCGVGIDISSLRPANAPVSNAAGTTSGAVSFMERFSYTTREVAQNGRRGALMITMDVAHPDIFEFVTIKQDLKKVTGANVSVRLSDEFMKAVEEDKEFTLRWPIDAPNPKFTKTIKARELWNTIIKCAHNTAEPGLIFWDRQHYYSTSSVYPGFKNISTNPCSEIAMQGGDSCRLMALNLFSFVENPFTKQASFNYKKFEQVVYYAQRLMDDLVDLELESIERILKKVESDPEPDFIKDVEIRTWKLLYETGKKGRRTGLGFTGLADCLAALNLKFDSDEALATVDKIMRTKLRNEFESSIDMAVERGKFEAFDTKYEEQSEFIQMMKKESPDVVERMMKVGRRNISISTVAPTGTLSILTQTSSGIEPVFLLSYKRRKKVNPSDKNARIDFVDSLGDAWQEFDVYHPKLKLWMEITGEKDITKSPYYGSTAPEIDWIKRVQLQAVVQKYTTHSISSTINLPSDVSVDKVGEIYLQSWKMGLKGITVYRDGSRTGVLVSADDSKKKETNISPKRPKSLEAEVVRFQNKNEKWIAVVGILNNKPYEIFTGKAEDAFSLPNYVTKGWVIKVTNEDGTKRYDFQYNDKDGYKVTIEGLSRSFDKEYWNYAKLISGILRQGMPLPQVVELVESLNFYDDNINSWKYGVARALKKFIPDGTKADKVCPSCGDPEGLVYEEGCLKCKSCGNTKCG